MIQAFLRLLPSALCKHDPLSPLALPNVDGSLPRERKAPLPYFRRDNSPSKAVKFAKSLSFSGRDEVLQFAHGDHGFVTCVRQTTWAIRKLEKGEEACTRLSSTLLPSLGFQVLKFWYLGNITVHHVAWNANSAPARLFVESN